MKFLSICSGIESASVAFGPLGWQAVGFSEIEAFPSAVLAHQYPEVPNFGDMTQYATWPAETLAQADAVVGGPPCQAFSVAGARKGLEDPRGNLTLTYVELINHVDTARAVCGLPPAVVLYENVPGILSDKTNAFGCFLAGLAGEDDPLEPPGGKWAYSGVVHGPSRTVAWRTFDAQYFGVAQRRRRVFVVASARDDFDPVSVLFEFDGVRRDSAPSRETGQGAAAGTLRSTDGGSDVDHARAQHLIAMAHGQGGAEIGFDRSPCLTCNHEAPIAAYTAPVATGWAVRRLTPRECERLQGFPDDYTLIPWRKKPAEQCPDGPRYKALGNSWAVPNARWIGARINAQLKC
jgi:site-specific DNA-cytosine methylase